MCLEVIKLASFHKSMELFGYVNEMRNNGCSVLYEMLQMKAQEVACKHNVPTTQFNARRSTICQKLPRDFPDKLESFPRFVLRM